MNNLNDTELVDEKISKAYKSIHLSKKSREKVFDKIVNKKGIEKSMKRKSGYVLASVTAVLCIMIAMVGITLIKGEKKRDEKVNAGNNSEKSTESESQNTTENKDSYNGQLEGRNDLIPNYYLKEYNEDGADFGNNIKFITEENKFVKIENGVCEDMEQTYMEKSFIYVGFDRRVEWYYCKDGDRVIYMNENPNNASESENSKGKKVYIATDQTSLDNYMVLCKNPTNAGYSWEYPLKINIKTGEYEDVFGGATINGKNIKEYEYLKNWEFSNGEIKVDYSTTYNEPESQTWERGIVETNNSDYTKDRYGADNEASTVIIPGVANSFGKSSVLYDSEILYFDGDKLIFKGEFGLFVYSLKDNEIKQKLNLRLFNLNSIQGDNECGFETYDNGRIVKMVNWEETYFYDTEKNLLYKGYDLTNYKKDTNENIHSFKAQEYNKRNLCSYNYADYNGYRLYLTSLDEELCVENLLYVLEDAEGAISFKQNLFS